MGVGQFGEYLASQFGETAESVNLTNFSEGCQSGDTAKAVNLANLLNVVTLPIHAHWGGGEIPPPPGAKNRPPKRKIYLPGSSCLT